MIIPVKIHIFIISFFIFLQYSLFPADKNLDYYLEAAYRNSPTLKELINSGKLSLLDKSLTDAQYSLPQVSITSNLILSPYFNNNGNYLTANPGSSAIGYDAAITNGGLYSALINVEKNIFNGSLLETYKSQSDIRINSYQNASELVKHSLKKDITDLYLRCYQAQQLILLTQAISDTLADELKIMQSFVSQGLTKQSDLILLKIEIGNQKIAEDQFKNDAITALYELNSICGLRDTSWVELGVTGLSIDSSHAKSNFLKQYTFDSLLTENQQKIFETKYLPQFNIFFNAGLNAVELIEMQRKFGISGGINFSLPIFDGNQRSITRQQSKISINTIHEYKSNQENNIFNKSHEAQLKIEFSRNNLQNIRRQLDDYSIVLKMSQSELFKGQISMIDYLTLVKNFLELKKNEISASVAELQAINEYNYWNW